MTGITNPAEEYFKDGTWGWDGTVWRKLSLLFGYSGVYEELEASELVAAGDHNLDFTPVAAGEVWVVTSVSGYSTEADADSIAIQLVRTIGTLCLKREANTVATLTVSVEGQIVLHEGDKVQVRFKGCLLNNSIYAQASGYKMKIAE